MMVMWLVFAVGLLSELATPSSALADARTSIKINPVKKVIKMLEDMKMELYKEAEDDKAVYEELMCWCKTGKADKERAIELAQSSIDRLKSSIELAAGKIGEMTAKRKGTRNELDADQKALNEATEQRTKDDQAFHAEEKDLLGAISSAKAAIVALSKQHPNLAQVRELSRELTQFHATQMVASSTVLGEVQAAELKSFLQGVNGGASFLSISGKDHYEPQSGQIFGILKQMQEDFEKNLSESQAAEKKAVKEFEMLKAAKKDEISTAEKLSVKLDEDIALFTEKHAQAASELEDTEQQLANDTEFLAALEKQCATAEAEFQARTKARNEEISAVEDTIQYLNSDEAYAAFDKNVNTASTSNKYSATDFLQISANSIAKEPERRKEASTLLQRAAVQMNSPQLALLAAKAQHGKFDKVIGDIDNMIHQLESEQASEVKLRDYCVNELNTARRSRQHAYDTKDSLVAKIKDLTQTIDQLTTDIKTSKDTIAETMKQMKRAGETREVENLDYQQVVSDQTITQAILTKALERMKEVYAFMQQPGAPHIQTSGTRTDPGNAPAKFTKYEQNAGGKRVVAMIEEVIADAKKTEDEAHASEADAQAAYEYFVKESNKSVTQLTTSINDMSVSLAKAKEELIMAKSDLAGVMTELQGIEDYVNALHRECDYQLKNFETRQDALTQEMDAMMEAKQILAATQ
eukprot:gnl/TRDRNA2_/TRDRNA2_176440_c2_seq29.p1 gnl/TRDRNA2_/TRDRNA2_176440_c2~~gnl/TRDRNA2_/TRDRNA2_176440_c2_seq29.p1  ORF type:complete len:695 (+),score=225.63 gnl/TRDRNA2_/TRDRNA2_176440_c2_seq29:88-2172(+)